MSDFIQVSKVNEVLNKRQGHFKPELGNVYQVKGKDDVKVKYAELSSIDYTKDFPYICNVILRESISIDGEVEAPVRLEERRFDYSGVSEDGKSTLLNLPREDKMKVGEPLDIDAFNGRSPKNVLECVSRTESDSSEQALTAFVIMLGLVISFIDVLSVCDKNLDSVLFMYAFFSWVGLTFVMMLVGNLHGEMICCRSPLIIIARICAVAAVFLSLCDIGSLAASAELSWTGLILNFVTLVVCLPPIALFYVHVKPNLKLNEARRKVFMVGNFNKFITGNGNPVVITNKFGDDNDFPMEGYIITHPEIRNGDLVIKERVIVAHRWNYNGEPEGYDENHEEFGDYVLGNTLEDARVVLDFFNKRHGVKSKSKAKSVSEKVDNGDDMTENQTSLLSKIAFIVNNLWSSKTGKVACFVLVAWAVNVIFGYKLHNFLNYIIPALAIWLAVYGTKSKLKI